MKCVAYEKEGLKDFVFALHLLLLSCALQQQYSYMYSHK